MLGDKIKEIRIAKGIDSKELAKMIGITPAYLSLIENNKRKNPNTELLNKIASVLGVNVQDLFDEESKLDEIDILEQEYKILFHKMKNLSPSDRQKILKMIEIFESENNE